MKPGGNPNGVELTIAPATPQATHESQRNADSRHRERGPPTTSRTTPPRIGPTSRVGSLLVRKSASDPSPVLALIPRTTPAAPPSAMVEARTSAATTTISPGAPSKSNLGGGATAGDRRGAALFGCERGPRIGEGGSHGWNRRSGARRDEKERARPEKQRRVDR